jgi:hypothetical protein
MKTYIVIQKFKIEIPDDSDIWKLRDWKDKFDTEILSVKEVKQ